MLTSCYVDGMDSGNYDNDRVGAWEAQRRIMSSLEQGVCGGSQICAGGSRGLMPVLVILKAFKPAIY